MLKLVQYDSDEEDQEDQDKKTTSKPLNEQKITQPSQKAGQKEQSGQLDKPREVNVKRVIKYETLQTSKNLLKGHKDADSGEWKPETFDFKKKDDAGQSEKPAFKPKKGNSYAASFLSNLPKPKKELKNSSQDFMVSNLFTYEPDSGNEVITKKLKMESSSGNFDDNLDDMDDLHQKSQAPTKKVSAASLQTFTEADKDVVYSYDKSNKNGPINVSSILEISAERLTDPNWEQNMEKKRASRLFDSNVRFQQPDKTAKGKNQLSSLAYDAVKNQDEYLSKANAVQDAKKRTSQTYGWS